MPVYLTEWTVFTYNIIAMNLPFCHSFREPGNYIFYYMTIYVVTGIREIYVRSMGSFHESPGVK